MTGADKSLDVLVDIFNRVNGSGTKLSKGDLALAKICADWPEGRDAMKAELKRLEQDGFHFNLDWLLRAVNTVLTGEATFQYLHEETAGGLVRRVDIAAVERAAHMASGASPISAHSHCRRGPRSASG